MGSLSMGSTAFRSLDNVDLPSGLQSLTILDADSDQSLDDFRSDTGQVIDNMAQHGGQSLPQSDEDHVLDSTKEVSAILDRGVDYVDLKGMWATVHGLISSTARNGATVWIGAFENERFSVCTPCGDFFRVRPINLALFDSDNVGRTVTEQILSENTFSVLQKICQLLELPHRNRSLTKRDLVLAILN